jgi:carbamoyl-phosphate synthase small subunit
MRGIISTNILDDAELVKRALASPGMLGRDLVKEVVPSKSFVWTRGGLDHQLTHEIMPAGKTKRKVVAMDFGMKWNILRCLTHVGCEVTVVPGTASAKEVLSHNPEGIFLSNGPGDPAGVPYAAQAVSRLLETGVPTFGICLGHQIIGLALGGRTYKLKFGHHGSNQPVSDISATNVQITAQNHNYAVDEESLPSNAEVTHRNLNDGTVEGLRLTDRPVFCVQYHPEASPGPHDADLLFARFARLVKGKADG